MNETLTLTRDRIGLFVGEHRRVAIVLAGAIVLALGYWLFLSPSAGQDQAEQGMQGPPPANVSIERVTRVSMTPRFTAPGDVVADRNSVVAAEVSGRVRSTLPVGATIGAGQVIAVIDDREANLALQRANAEIARQQADLDFQETRLARLTQLSDRGFATKADYDEAVSARDQARSALSAARIQRANAELSLARTRIVSPFAGQVAERLIEVGEYATPGREVARIVGRDGAEARARIPIASVGTLSPGQPIEILANGRTLQSTVRAVIETGDEVSRTIEVRAPLGDQSLEVGSAISLTVPTGERRRALTVPRDALVLRESGIFIYVVDTENKSATRVDVEVGEPVGDRIEVIGKLKPGQFVVVRGGERLRDGQPVLWDAKSEVALRSAAKAPGTRN